jgi:hypothetical protein
MSQNIHNIYCDESCHLENDHQDSMFLGGIWCEKDKTKEILTRIKECKIKHGLKSSFEIKWTKVSPKKVDFYLDIIDYFFDNKDMHFRCLIIPDKKKLNHDRFNQDHDSFYYKMYFNMLKTILDPNDEYKIYIDIKDTRGAKKIKKLQEVLCNSLYDFDRSIVSNIQLVHSHEVGILQIADLIIGAVSYNFRKLNTSEAKLKLVARIKERSGYDLDKTTLLKENKVNLFVWEANEDN